MAEELEISSFESAEAFEAWLDRHHDSSPGIWLKLRKKVRGVVALDYAHALDVALCYGWIDGQKGRFDDEYWLQRFTPRKSKSKWSKINRDKVAALTEQGRMRPPGVAEVERAKADGRWESAYAGAKSAEVPDDLAEASRRTRPRPRSSRSSTRTTATRFCTASRTSRRPRPGPGGSRST